MMVLHCIQEFLSDRFDSTLRQPLCLGACNHVTSDLTPETALPQLRVDTKSLPILRSIHKKLLSLLGGSLFLVATLLATTDAFANDSTNKIYVSATPGSYAVIGSVGCVPAGTSLPDNVRVLDWGSEANIVIHASPDRHDPVEISVTAGTRNDAKECVNPSERKYEVSFRTAPEVSSSALQKSFQVLMAAFVLAVLLESAFALIFNWRPFYVLLVGKAWRTPIMLAGSWLVVNQFNFDLMAQLFDAYFPQQSPSPGDWGTSLLTAMILAGGSSGVNRIMLALGFRRDQKELEPKLDDKHAWLSVEVVPAYQGQKLLTSIKEVDAPPSDVIDTVGIAGNPRPSLSSIFRGNDNRVPRSGGLQVDVSKYYQVTVRDIDTDKVFDVSGKEISSQNISKAYKFGPRSVIDFRIKLVE